MCNHQDAGRGIICVHQNLMDISYRVMVSSKLQHYFRRLYFAYIILLNDIEGAVWSESVTCLQVTAQWSQASANLSEWFGVTSVDMYQ